MNTDLALFMLVLAIIADIGTTMHGLRRGAEEAMSLAERLQETIGLLKWALARAVAGIAIGIGLAVAERPLAIMLLATITLAVAANNVRVSR